ncbi:hypothetical protein J3E68DRAFT_281639 [Trichoderma sp. SZMC 28012]
MRCRRLMYRYRVKCILQTDFNSSRLSVDSPWFMHSNHRTTASDSRFRLAPESSPSSVLLPFFLRLSFTHRRIRTRQAPWPVVGGPPSKKRYPPFRGRIEGKGHPCRPESLCRPMAGHPLVQSTCRRMGRNGGSTCAGGRSKRGTSTRWDSRSCFRSAMHESGLLSRSASPLVQFRPVSVQSSIVARERDIRSVWLWFWLTSPRTQWGHRCPTLPLCRPWPRPSLITHTC